MSTKNIVMAAAGNSAGVPASYWFLDISTTAHVYTSCAAVLSSDVYIGTANSIIKTDYNGVVQWKKTYTSLNLDVNSIYKNVVSDPQNSVIYCAGFDYAGTNTITKIDTNGNAIWQKNITLSGVTNFYVTGICVSAGYLYVQLVNVTNNQTIIAKLDSSGAIQQQFKINTFTNGPVFVDTSGNIYSSVAISGGGGGIIKLNSSGVIQWQRAYNSSYADCQSINVDSSGNVYASGLYASGTYSIVVKYDSSGTLQWARRVSATNGLNSLIFDSLGYLYVSQSRGTWFAKINTSDGSINWQRNWSYTGGSNFSNSWLNVNENDEIIVNGRFVKSYSIGFALKVPSNGTKTGTYGSFVYSTPSVANASITPTQPSISFSVSSVTLSISSSTPTVGTDTRTVTKTTIT